MANKDEKNGQPQAGAKEEKAEKASAKVKGSAVKANVQEERIKELEAQVKDLEAKLDDEKNGYLRLMAEFETFRRRTAEDRLALVSSASADTIKGLLPVLDDCERALEILSEADAAAREGTTLIYNKLMAYLQGKGLSRIEARGQKFDVDFHEAVTQFPAADESQKGVVIDVIQTGYMLADKVIRYAKVVVGV